jgi:phosphoglucosamine mutase
MRKLFGTDGIRGLANAGDVTPEVAFRLGRAGACFFKSRHKTPSIVVGRDTRLSGDMLEGALVAGISSMGVNVLRVGVMPTPAIAWLTARYQADAGVVISASHNSFEDNGIKFFSPLGEKLSDETEAKIEALYFGAKVDAERPTAEGVGRVLEEPGALSEYCGFARRTVPEHLNLRNMHIVVDCGHGATYLSTPEVLRRLGARVTVLNDQPDGRNINANCGSTFPQAMQEAVVRLGADCGLAHDGDGDRVLMADESGTLVDGDRMLGLYAIHRKQQGKLPKDTVVATVMSNLGFEQAMEKAGITLLRAQVGDRYVLELMKKSGSMLGGEQSGHIIFRRHQPTGDGLITALQMLRVIKESGKPLAELAGFMTEAPQILVNVKLAKKKDIKSVKPLAAEMARVEKLLGKQGRLLVRWSGTEPKLRIMIEGQSMAEIEALAGRLAELAKKHIK